LDLCVFQRQISSYFDFSFFNKIDLIISSYKNCIVSNGWTSIQSIFHYRYYSTSRYSKIRIPVLGSSSLFWVWKESGGYSYSGNFSWCMFVHDHNSKGLGESFPSMWLNIGLGLSWKIYQNIYNSCFIFIPKFGKNFLQRCFVFTVCFYPMLCNMAFSKVEDIFFWGKVFEWVIKLQLITDWVKNRVDVNA